MCSKEEAEERRRLSEVSIFERRSTFMYHECDDRNNNASNNYISTLSNNINSRNRSHGKQVCFTMRRNGKSSLQRRLEAALEQQKRYENCSVGDPSLLVKKYRRSAAGRSTCSSRLLTLKELEITTNHLLFTVFACAYCRSAVDGRIDQVDQDTDVSFSYASFDAVAFVHDRLRAVQVDLSMGRFVGISDRLSSDRVTMILAKMIRYYALTGYFLCENNKFDMTLHLQ